MTFNSWFCFDSMIYLIDGSIEGLLCAVFEWFERKPGQVILKTERHYQPEAFSTVFQVYNDTRKADRVWKGLIDKLSKGWIRKIYCTYLSETPEAYHAIFEFAKYIFMHPKGSEHNYGNEHVLSIFQTAMKVEREKHRMEAFIRFQHSLDGLFYCGINPDFNVLPLLAKHFKDRYADQKWIIFDIRRHYGLLYDLEKVQEVAMDLASEKNLRKKAAEIHSESESIYSALWKDYFKSTNIPSRKNTKLHIRHVPKRYWRYLTEKQDL